MRGLYLFILILLSVFLLYPVYFVLEQSLLVDGAITPYFILRAITDTDTLILLFRSLDLALMTVALAAAISIPLAVLFARYTFPLRNLFQGLLFFPMILPPFVGAVGLRQMLSRFGPLNLLLVKCGVLSEPVDFLGEGGLFAVSLTQALHLFPILYLNVCAAIGSRDPLLEDAACSVGASRAQVLRRITAPLLTPSFFAGAVIVFIWSFTDIGTPLVFRVERLLPVAVFNLRDQVHHQPQGYVLSLLTLAVSMVLFVIARMHSGGQTASATKGIVHNAPRRLPGPQTAAVLCLVVILLSLALLPHLGVLLLSISSEWFMTVLPSRVNAEAYQLVFTHPLTARSIVNSLLLSVSSTVCDIALGLSIAWIVLRTNMRGRRLLDTLTMLPLAIPGVILAFAYLGAFSGFPALDPRVNPFPLLIIGYAMRRLPFMVRSVSAGLQQAHAQLEEAAMSAGASTGMTFRRITLPLLFPHIAAGTILTFAFAMLEVSESLLLAMEDRFFPITKAMFVLLARPDGLSLASALGILGMLLTGGSLLLASKILGKDFGSVMRL